MADINKELPFELDPNSKYAVRVRSINAVGQPSEWSETAIVYTQDSVQPSSSRLETDQSGIYAYDENGKLVFIYSSATNIRENLVINPSFGTDAAGWTANTNSTITRDTSLGFTTDTITASLKVEASVAAADIGFTSSVSARQSATTDEIYTGSAYIKTPTTLENKSFLVGIQFFDVSGNLLIEIYSPPTIIKSTDEWVRVNAIKVKAPVSTASVGIAVKCSSDLAIGEYFNVDAILLENSELLRQYFDGSTSAGASAWVGTAHASKSLFEMSSAYHIDSAYITEGVFQTSDTVETEGGIIIDPTALRAYSPSGVMKVKIDALTGDITAIDGIFTGSVFRTGLGVGEGSPATPGVIFDNAGIRGYSGTAATPAFEVDIYGNLYAQNADITGNINATSGTFSGTISATTGAIGGWQVASTALYSNSGQTGMSSGATPFWAGGATPNATFAVTSSGSLRATNANITGAIYATSGTFAGALVAATGSFAGDISAASGTFAGSVSATSGSIGGWTIVPTSLYSNSGTVGIGSGATPFWAGGASPNATFVVTSSGSLKATNANITGNITATSGSFTGTVTANTGAIGGWNITTGSLFSNSGTVGMSSGATPFWAGSASPSAPFVVTSSGNLKATNANITGTITATGGSIAGWTIGDVELYKGSGASKIALHASATPKFYIGIGNHGAADTAFYADSGGRFSLGNQLIFNPGISATPNTDDFAELTVTGKIRGAIENVTLIPSNKLQVNITGVQITSATAATITTDVNAFLTNEYIVIEGLTGNASACNGVWQITAVSSTQFSITIVGGIVSNTTGITGATATLREVTLGLHPSLGSGTYLHSAGIGIRLDRYNWWMTNNQFRVGTSGTYMKWNGTRLDISGAGTKTLSMAVGAADADNYFAIANNGITPAYNSSTTQFIVNAEGKLSLGTALTWDGSTLTVSGAISGGTIDIGGADGDSFHVDASGNMWLGSGLYSTAPFRVAATGDLDIGGTDASSLHVDSIGRLWSGASTFGSAPFYVNNNGDLYASISTFSGLVTAQNNIALTNGYIYANTGAAKFGMKVDNAATPSLHGLYIDSSNYWYTNGSMRIGGSNGLNLSAGNVTMGNAVSLTGSVGNASTSSQWLTPRTINLGGDLSGSVSIDGSSDVTLTATIAGSGVDLGTDTTGSYVATLIGTGNQIGITGAGNEGATPQIFLPQNIHTGATPTFGSMTLSQSGGGSKLSLSGVTSNWIDWAATGTGAPTFTTRSAGTKLILYPTITGSQVDYGFGIESSIMWSSVATTSSSFKWYGGTTTAMTLTGTGNLTPGNNIVMGASAIVQSRYFTNVANTGPYIDNAGSNVIVRNRTTESNVPLIVRGMAAQSGALQQWQDSTATVLASISATGTLAARLPTFTSSNGNLMVLKADGGIDHGYLTFYIDTDNPSTRSGYFGYGSSGTTTLTLANEMTNGPINLSTNGIGGFTFNGNTVWHAGNDGSGSGLDADLLDGQSGAYYLPSASYTAADVLSKLLTVDGAASTLDADLLDGQHGSYYLDWTNVTNKPDPVITLGGDLTGSVTLTDLASGTLTAAIAANSVALGTDTSGNYIATIAGTTNQVNVSGSGSETAAVTLSLPQNIDTGATTTFLSSLLTNGEVSGGITKRQLEFFYPGSLYGHNIKTRHNSGAQLNNAIDFYVWRYGTDATPASGTARVASLDFSQSNFYSPTVINSNLTVTGNLQVDGTTITVSSASMTVSDPIITLGGSATPASDDNKDRGIKYHWHNGSVGKVGYFGYDDSTGKFTFIPDATDTLGVFSGTKGELDANVDWTNILNKPDPVVTVTLTGDVTGTGNATLTDLASGSISFTTTIAADSVALGSDTTGNYIATLAGTTNQVLVNGGTAATSTESTAVTLSLPTAVTTGSLTLNTATGPQLSITGATSNLIALANAGVAAPTFTTRSDGTKILLWNGLTVSAADYAIGIEASTLWNSVPSTSQQFKWYGGTTLAATLTGTGIFTPAASIVMNTGTTVQTPNLTAIGNVGPYMALNTTSTIVTNRGSTAYIPFRVRGMASQSGNLQTWENSGGTALAYISAAGVISGPSATLTSPTHTADSVPTLARFGAGGTGGTLDWNDVTNTRPGGGPSLLLGSATNGPGGGHYFHPWNIEYAGKDGTGNVTQFAIPYSAPMTEYWVRGRYSGVWSGWQKVWFAGNDGAGSGMDADLLDAQQGTYYLDLTNATNTLVDTKLATISTADKVSLSALNIDGGTDIGAALADADLFIVDDGGAGTNRKAAATRISDYVFGKVSSDITITTAGVATASTNILRSEYLSTRSLADANNADAYGVMFSYLNGSNKPTGTDHAAFTMSYSTSWSTQMAADWRTNNWYVRTQNSGTWGSWATLWHSANDGASSGLDADLLDGQEGSYYLDWTNATNKPDPVVTVNLTGDVTGSGNATLTDLASGTINIATTVATSTEVSDTAPVGPTVGQLWFNSSIGKLFIYFDSSWVQVGGIV